MLLHLEANPLLHFRTVSILNCAGDSKVFSATEEAPARSTIDEKVSRCNGAATMIHCLLQVTKGDGAVGETQSRVANAVPDLASIYFGPF